MPDIAGPRHKPMVLMVDDDPDTLALMAGLLKDRYQVKVASSGERGIRIAAMDPPPDLILLDILMPDNDGYEVLRRLKSYPSTREIPVVFLTSRSDPQSEQEGLDLGAVDYITKPISAPIFLARIRNHLLLKDARDFLKNRNLFLEMEVARRTREVAGIQDVTIVAMASLAETRDNETGNHIRRTQSYVKALAWRLHTHPRFCGFLTPANIDLAFRSAPLHDIGKVGIPDSILLKEGKLTLAEFEIMKTHPTLGKDAIEAAERRLGTPVGFLAMAKEIAYCHQEKWDGSGYPQGLKGDAIPIPARLMALADVYDALISRRVYKPALDHESATAIIREGRGSHFDPDVVDAFLEAQEAFRGIARTFADEP